jgi:hypothetical protein
MTSPLRSARIICRTPASDAGAVARPGRSREPAITSRSEAWRAGRYSTVMGASGVVKRSAIACAQISKQPMCGVSMTRPRFSASAAAIRSPPSHCSLSPSGRPFCAIHSHGSSAAMRPAAAMAGRAAGQAIPACATLALKRRR